MLTLWRARRAGLSDDDMRAMSFSEFDAWLELYDWTNETEDDDTSVGLSSEASERVFFHL